MKTNLIDKEATNAVGIPVQEQPLLKRGHLQPDMLSQAATQHGIAVDRFARKIGAF
jgi:hypothetical protein